MMTMMASLTKMSLMICLVVDGHWSEWDEWECEGSCGTSTFISYRSCNNPKPRYMGKTCEGYFVRKNNSSCKGLVECGQNCTRRRYGYQCAFTCDNCVSNCHPVNGSCAECLPGWRDPRLACNTPCPEWTYGFRCEMMCEKKCGVDCVSRVDGACPESNMMFISSVWTVLLLGLITLAFIALWYNEATRLTLLLMVSAIKGKNYIWRYKNKKGEKILVLTTPNLYKKLTSTKKKKGRKGKKSTRVFLSEVDGQTIRTGKKRSKKKKKAKASAKGDTGKKFRKKKLSAKKLAKKRARKLAKKKRKQLQQTAGSSTQVDGKDAADVTPSMWSEITSYVKESIKYNSLASTPNQPSPKSVSEVPSTNVSGGKDTDTKMAAQIKTKSSSTNASATKGSKSPESPKNIFEPPSPNIVSTRRKSEPPSLKIHSPKSKSEPPSPKIPSPKTKSQPPSPKIDSPKTKSQPPSPKIDSPKTKSQPPSTKGSYTNIPPKAKSKPPSTYVSSAQASQTMGSPKTKSKASSPAASTVQAPFGTTEAKAEHLPSASTVKSPFGTTEAKADLPPKAEPAQGSTTTEPDQNKLCTLS
ncbi:nascent polypeptide-associated complex subunit alpha, muscle-specific form-like isoform X2 [Physella acuta]|uniref:nascent polypeptide-associated complex subunit alpha, muscle-specific form-like isoform X2 n=1 Tax=Physella acuta TaxID=109671 RepID=UPI0027DC22F9|nr:nascent polypeptide-associated complex subunit alpha, muscle-specific form-like isoform X2 [Physella acuta]